MNRLFKNFKNWFRGQTDKAAEALDDPTRDGKFAIEDAKRQESDFRKDCCNLIAATNEMERDLDDAKAEEQKWDRIAKSAAAKVKSGDESAKEDLNSAAKEVKKFRNRINELTVQITKNETIEQQLKQQIENVQNKIDKAEQNYTTLAARQKAATIRKEIASAAARIESARGGLAELDKLEDAVNKTESMADAYEEMACTSNKTNLEEKYSSVESEDLVNEYLK